MNAEPGATIPEGEVPEDAGELVPVGSWGDTPLIGVAAAEMENWSVLSTEFSA